MIVCPVDLQHCDRPACAGGHCEIAGELRMLPCYDCGYLIVRRGAGLCVECVTIALVETSEV